MGASPDNQSWPESREGLSQVTIAQAVGSVSQKLHSIEQVLDAVSSDLQVMKAENQRSSKEFEILSEENERFHQEIQQNLAKCQETQQCFYELAGNAKQVGLRLEDIEKELSRSSQKLSQMGAALVKDLGGLSALSLSTSIEASPIDVEFLHRENTRDSCYQPLNPEILRQWEERNRRNLAFYSQLQEEWDRRYPPIIWRATGPETSPPVPTRVEKIRALLAEIKQHLADLLDLLTAITDKLRRADEKSESHTFFSAKRTGEDAPIENTLTKKMK